MLRDQVSIRTVVLAGPLLMCVGLLVVGSGRRTAAQAPAPDLIVRDDVLARQWVVRDEELSPTDCSVMEGGITPGSRRLLRFTVTTPNIGTGDLVIGDPNEHVAAGDGLFEFASCHHHYHFRHYALYELVGTDGTVWRAAKQGFCMLDTDPNPAYFGRPPRVPQYRSCGSFGVAGNQGISAGWADTYKFFLPGQYFVLDGGDGQLPVPPGDYSLRITVNPPFVAQTGEPCPHVDGAGFCHQLPELEYSNNSVSVPIVIPKHPGRQGVGPLAGSASVNEQADCHGKGD